MSDTERRRKLGHRGVYGEVFAEEVAAEILATAAPVPAATASLASPHPPHSPADAALGVVLTSQDRIPTKRVRMRELNRARGKMCARGQL